MAERTKSELELLCAQLDGATLRQANELTKLKAELTACANLLGNARAALETKERHLAAANASFANALADVEKADIARRNAIKQRDDTLAQFGELKARLFVAEERANRAQGYIDRVRELDMPRSASGGDAVGHIPATDDSRPHWVNYGQR